MKAKIYIGAKKYALYIGRKIVEKTLEFLTLPARFISNKVQELKNLELYGNSRQSLLPDGYTQLEYIESTGTQYIDTGIYGELETELKFVGQVTKYSSSNYGHLWGDLSDSAKAITLSTPIRSNLDATSRFGNTSAEITSSPEKLLPLNETVTIIENKEKVTSSNGIELIFNATDEFTTNKTLILFGAYGASDIAQAKHNFKCFYFSHKKNGILVQELIPARRNSDNKVGMYDTVNNQFLTNAGTGEFIAGNNATSTPTPTAPIEIESVGDKTKNLFNENDEGIAYGRNISASGTESSSSISSSTYYIKVKPNTDYTIEFISLFSGSVTRYHLYDTNKTWLQQVKTNTSSAPGSIETVNFTTTSDTQYLRFTMRGTSASQIKDGNIQLEEGNTATSYEPYGYKVPVVVGGATTNIYLSEPLRKVGTFSDTLLITGTNVTVVRNVEVIDETGTKTIEESLIHKVPSTTETYTIDNPIELQEGSLMIDVNTNIKPSKINITGDIDNDN